VIRDDDARPPRPPPAPAAAAGPPHTNSSSRLPPGPLGLCSPGRCRGAPAAGRLPAHPSPPLSGGQRRILRHGGPPRLQGCLSALAPTHAGQSLARTTGSMGTGCALFCAQTPPPAAAAPLGAACISPCVTASCVVGSCVMPGGGGRPRGGGGWGPAAAAAAAAVPKQATLSPIPPPVPSSRLLVFLMMTQVTRREHLE
jgi:hypothetical protein